MTEPGDSPVTLSIVLIARGLPIIIIKLMHRPGVGQTPQCHFTSSSSSAIAHLSGSAYSVHLEDDDRLLLFGDQQRAARLSLRAIRKTRRRSRVQISHPQPFSKHVFCNGVVGGLTSECVRPPCHSLTPQLTKTDGWTKCNAVLSDYISKWRVSRYHDNCVEFGNLLLINQIRWFFVFVVQLPRRIEFNDCPKTSVVGDTQGFIK